MERIGEHRKKRIKLLDETLDLYTKLRNEENLEQSDIKHITFDVNKNKFKVNDMTYKESRFNRMKIEEWENVLKDLKFKVHMDYYKCNYNKDFIVCGDERETQDMIYWSAEVDVSVYKEESERCFKIGMEANGKHSFYEKKETEKDKCYIKFYIGELETDNIVVCKGYDLKETEDTVKIVEKLCKCLKENDIDDYPEYFCKYKKVSELGRKILKIIIKKYIKIILHNSSFYYEDN